MIQSWVGKLGKSSGVGMETEDEVLGQSCFQALTP